MGLDVLFIKDVEQITLAGVVLSIRCAQRQGYDEQFLAGVLAQAEHTCIASKGDWRAVLGEVRARLDSGQCGLLDAALTATTSKGDTCHSS